jgi:hypothetical protein
MMQPSDTSQIKPATRGADEATTPEIVSEISAAGRGLRYGSIVVTIHDSKVVQIEKNERVRL